MYLQGSSLKHGRFSFVLNGFRCFLQHIFTLVFATLCPISQKWNIACLNIQAHLNWPFTNKLWPSKYLRIIDQAHSIIKVLISLVLSNCLFFSSKDVKNTFTDTILNLCTYESLRSCFNVYKYTFFMSCIIYIRTYRIGYFNLITKMTLSNVSKLLQYFI